MRRLGRRVSHLSDELAETEHALAQLVAELAPDLLNECGAGPVCAAQLLVSAGNPARMRNEASFAALAGTSPVEASSGHQRRHRLTAAATADSTGPSTSSHSTGPTTTPKPPATTNDSSQPAKPAEKHAAVSNTPSPATSTNASAKYQPPLDNIEASGFRLRAPWLVGLITRRSPARLRVRFLLGLSG